MLNSGLRRLSAISRLLASAGIVCALLACGEHQENFYPTLADADKAGATARGWIPDEWLPRSTRAIHEAQELSPENEWCAFDFDPADSQKLRRVLMGIDPLPALVLHARPVTQTESLASSVKHIPNPQTSWWPEILRSDLDIAKIRSAGFEVYTVERQATQTTTATYLFAIDWLNGRGYLYTD